MNGRVLAVMARNEFHQHNGEEAALDVQLPEDDDGDDYCVRVELEDLDGVPRGAVVDIGAFERNEAPDEVLTGLNCGDGVVQRGLTPTETGTFLGFETCDDGARVNGDGCSAFCQWGPRSKRGDISMVGSRLCAIREDHSLSCWGGAEENMPSGTFQQVAVGGYHTCALTLTGELTCWDDVGDGAVYTPVGIFRQITGGADTCGLRDDGALRCWDDLEETFAADGPYVRVDDYSRTCAFSAAGEATCWGMDVELPEGPLVQTLPTPLGGCSLRASGEVVCLDQFDSPQAGFISMARGPSTMVALRPDGRVLQWNGNRVELPAQDHVFIEVAAGNPAACGLAEDHRLWCWSGLDRPAPGVKTADATDALRPRAAPPEPATRGRGCGSRASRSAHPLAGCWR